MSLARAMVRWPGQLWDGARPGTSRRAALPASGGADWDTWLGVRAPSGVTVTPDSALGVTTVMACVQLIARALASVPLAVYERVGETGRRPAIEHPLYRLLHDLPNPLMTSFEVRMALFASVLLYGNAYAEVDWDEDGMPAALWPLAPNRVQLWITPERQAYYTVQRDDGRTERRSADRIHHLRGLTLSGSWLGISPLRASNAIGLAMATEEFGSRFFGSGAHPSVVLSHPGKLTPEAMRNLRESFERQWSGLGNAHRVAVVGEGVKPEAMRIAPNEAQMLESRMFQVLEIARIFNVAPGLVGAAETQTYASAEQDLIRFRELTLGPWAEAHEKAILRDLLVGPEQTAMFAQYKLAKLQATDLKTRYEAHQTAVLSGLETPNERRMLEDLNPIEGGDELWMPLNMALARHAAQQNTGGQYAGPESVEESADEAAQRQVMAAWVADVERRLAARVTNDVRQAGAKALRTRGPDGLAEWGEAMQQEWREAGEEMLRPVQAAGDMPAADVAGWVGRAYLAAAEGLTHE